MSPTSPELRNCSLHDLTFREIGAELERAGLKRIHAAPIWRALYGEEGDVLLEREDLPPRLREWIHRQHSTEHGLTPRKPEQIADIASSDGLTHKFLLRLADGQTVETVLMGYAGRFTACVSTQAGCAMGCVFCATGQMGFVRHLQPSEIVAQVMHTRRALGSPENGASLRNLVLMGMGEPLHNYDAVMQALEIITDRGGINIGPAKITISTVGVVPGIRRLADEKRPYNLAVSLHAATEEERTALIPAGKRWSLLSLIDACRYYCSTAGRRIFVEWTLIAGRNDTEEQARALVALLAGIDAHVNLIPLNPTTGFSGTATADAAGSAFQAAIQQGGIPCTIRQRRGIDVAAGCGQLKAEKGLRRASYQERSSDL